MVLKFSLIIIALLFISHASFSQNEISKEFWNKAVTYNTLAVDYYNDYGEDIISCEKLEPLKKACEFYQKTIQYIEVAITYEENSSNKLNKEFIRKCENAIYDLKNKRSSALEKYVELENFCKPEEETIDFSIYGKPTREVNNTGLLEPIDVGNQVFNMLKNLDNSTKESFVSNFLTIEEIWEIGKQLNENSEQFTSISEDRWQLIIESVYERIKLQGNNWNINWEEIKYSDFEFKKEEENGINGFKGTLFFKFNENSFKIDLFSILHDGKYKLFKVVPVKSITE